MTRFATLFFISCLSFMVAQLTANAETKASYMLGFPAGSLCGGAATLGPLHNDGDSMRPTADNHQGSSSELRRYAQNSSARAEMLIYTTRVREKINKAIRYPLAAREQQQSGTAVVKFRVNKGGRVTSLVVIRSSGSHILDGAALAAVANAAPFPRIPNSARRSTWGFTVPLQFQP